MLDDCFIYNNIVKLTKGYKLLIVLYYIINTVYRLHVLMLHQQAPLRIVQTADILRNTCI